MQQDADEAAASGEPARLLEQAQRLLDAGRPFHAHEVLEAGWKQAPAAERELWRALAQLAVGITHRRRGNPAGARALLVRSAEGLELYGRTCSQQGTVPPHGVDVDGLADIARRLATGEDVIRVNLLAG